MTAPAPGITHRRILAIAVPITLSNVSVPLLGLVDTGVVGQMGQAEPIGAVGVGAILLSAFYWVFGFLRMGTTGMVSQALGRKDSEEVRALLWRGLLIAALGGLGVIALQVPLFWAGFALSPASETVEGLARDYMRLRVYGAPATIGLYAVTGWLIAKERTRDVLLLQLWMNGVNILLDLLFVLELGWGVRGVALATFLAETSGFALGLWMCRAALRGGGAQMRRRVLDRVRLREMMMVNADILVRSVLLQGVFLSFLLIGASFGDVPLAANQVLLQFLEVTAYGLDGFAFAAEVLVGQAFGAGDRRAVWAATRHTMAWAVILSLPLAAGFALGGGWVIDLLTTAPDVRAEARAFLPWMVAAPVLGAASWIFDGIYVGAVRSRDMRNMMVVSVAIYAVSLWLMLPHWGNHGLWAALLISFVARAGSLAWRYPTLLAAAGRR